MMMMSVVSCALELRFGRASRSLDSVGGSPGLFLLAGICSDAVQRIFYRFIYWLYHLIIKMRN